jgi:hypothetical protein
MKRGWLMIRPRKEPPETLTASAAVLERNAMKQEIEDLRSLVLDIADRSVPLELGESDPFCTYCGVGLWSAVNTNPCCELCERSIPMRTETGGLNSEFRELFRSRVFIGIIGPDAKPYGDARECGVVFHDELPVKKRVVGSHRWAHLDFDMIRRKNTLAMKKAEIDRRMNEGPRFRPGEPCWRCGCAYMWVDVPAQDGYEEHLAFIDSDGNPGHVTHPVSATPAGVKCGGCSDLPTKVRNDSGGASDLGEVFAEILGLHQLDERVVNLGVRWYSDLPPHDKRRKLVNAPFQYLGDLHEMRCNIFRETAPLEGQWRSHGLWEQLNRDPRSHTRPGETS